MPGAGPNSPRGSPQLAEAQGSGTVGKNDGWASWFGGGEDRASKVPSSGDGRAVANDGFVPGSAPGSAGAFDLPWKGSSDKAFLYCIPVLAGFPTEHAISMKSPLRVILIVQACVCFARFFFLQDFIGGLWAAVAVFIGVHGLWRNMNITYISVWGTLCTLNGLFDIVQALLPYFFFLEKFNFLKVCLRLACPVAHWLGASFAYHLYLDFAEVNNIPSSWMTRIMPDVYWLMRAKVKRAEARYRGAYDGKDKQPLLDQRGQPPPNHTLYDTGGSWAPPWTGPPQDGSIGSWAPPRTGAPQDGSIGDNRPPQTSAPQSRGDYRPPQTSAPQSGGVAGLFSLLGSQLGPSSAGDNRPPQASAPQSRGDNRPPQASAPQSRGDYRPPQTSAPQSGGDYRPPQTSAPQSGGVAGLFSLLGSQLGPSSAGVQSASHQAAQFATQAADHGRNYSQQAVDHGRNYGQQAVDHGRNYGQQAVDHGRNYGQQAVDNGRNYGQQAVDRGQYHGQQAVDRGRGYGQQAPGASDSLWNSFFGEQK
eukprot:TRINITY_DN3193_c0_g1_i2.p1 TRINITY_DN3193_c0_g1~~TRINITY_DN3193_c0_g1_i2.p1  ORF type:complete len:533 (+),score=82.47 TRINITY_DN3193_c0_g1_i2:87-1685(+)